MQPIRPGATLGILGGGQLGRMTALAARSLGYSVHALDPDPTCPARGVVDRLVTAGFDDSEAAADLAAGCDVVTLEIEKIAIASLEAAARRAPLRPAASVLEVVQDRARQKAWLASHGFPLGAFRAARSAAELEEAVRRLGGACVAKAVIGGYDGRSQVPVPHPSAARAAWDALGGGPCIVERLLALEREISVLVARRPGGESVVYPPALNHHADRILDWSVMPAPVAPELAARAGDLGRRIAEALDVEGLLAVEMFVVEGDLLVNELAPRPHNSFHHTEVACVTSQFEQVVRAVCDLPLGSVEVLRPAALVNLLGDLWLGARPPAFEEVLKLPGVKLFLYGKQEARPGRKMGHLCAIGADPEQAVARARAARQRLAEGAAKSARHARESVGL
ncbi:MAG TPA: 5-(carboxyamino)imidazole ribonucleotide synthase [Gemmatimonadota bacterium]|jgi:5-(carboxyamino)imidazole ribonucleotide synthase